MAWVEPDGTQHIYVIGRTGSGKTQAGMWHLSRQDFSNKTWVAVDTKGEGMIAAVAKMDGAKVISLNETPTKPGFYVVRTLPHQADNGELDNFLWKIWGHENIGLMFDEGYMVGDSDAFKALLTQGRSKHIPLIVLTQRPAWITRFVRSEASFFQIFWLNDADDRKNIQRLVPFDLDNRLPEYHSLWYDVVRDRVSILKPVPPREAILETFRSKLEPKRVYL